MVESSARPKTRQRVLVKHSSEVKPTDTVEAGTELREYDTGNIFEFSGEDWYQTSTAGVGWSNPRDSGGTELTSTTFTSAAWTVDDAVARTSAALDYTTDVVDEASNWLVVIADLSGGETISWTGYISAAMTVETAAFLPKVGNTEVLAAATALVNGTYILRDVKAHKMRFVKSADVNSATITILGWV